MSEETEPPIVFLRFMVLDGGGGVLNSEVGTVDFRFLPPKPILELNQFSTGSVASEFCVIFLFMFFNKFRV